MKRAMPESVVLYNSILSKEQRYMVDEILEEINTNIKSYSTKLLWEVDKGIGGIGGYCMPCDPKLNPYPGGEYRLLFRPLQYARSEIDVSNIHMHSRYVITNSGLHLEGVTRLVLSKYSLFGNLRYMNITLGNATKVLEKEKSIQLDLIEGLYLFVKLYNKSKHEVNHDDSRERLFAPSDAIVGYLSARIMGYKLLNIIKHDSINHIYRIDETEFKGL